MPPTNTSATTAYDLGTLPADYTQTDINDAGVNYDVWYKFTAPAGAKVIGAWLFSGNTSGSTYRPTISPFSGPAAAPVNILFIAGQNRPIQFPVTALTEYFIKATKNINTAGPEDLRVRVEVAPDNTVEAGDIYVNDDTVGFPLAVLSGDTNHTVRKFYNNVVAGEAGDILQSSSRIILSDEFTSFNFRLYDNDFNQITTIAQLNSGTPRIRANQTLDKFYIANAGINPTTDAQFRSVTSAGALGSIVTLPDPLLQSLCSDNTESILYYNRGNGFALQRWNITGGSPLSDLAAAVASYTNPDILVIPDGTILVLYWKPTATRDLYVRRYNASGTLLNTYSLGSDHAATMPRMAYALDGISFWVWTHPVVEYPEGTSKFQNIRVSDGLVLETRIHTEYESGVYLQGETATPTGRFGNSFSCPFMIAVGGGPAPPSPYYGGIYVIVPGKTNDTVNNAGVELDVAIPDPTFKTGLIG